MNNPARVPADAHESRIDEAVRVWITNELTSLKKAIASHELDIKQLQERIDGAKYWIDVSTRQVLAFQELATLNGIDVIDVGA